MSETDDKRDVWVFVPACVRAYESRVCMCVRFRETERVVVSERE